MESGQNGYNNLEWRRRAKFVALFDITMLCTTVGVFCFLIYQFTVNNGGINSMDDVTIVLQKLQFDTETPEIGPWITWLVTFSCVVFISIQIWAAFILLSSAKSIREPNQAVALAGVWRHVVVFITAVTIIGNILQMNWPSVILVALWRGMGLWIVSKFMAELQVVISSSSVNTKGYAIDVAVKY